MTPQLDPSISRKLGQFATSCSVFAVGFGLWVLAGWIFHVHIMRSILPGQVAVKANASVCFILIGLALWVLRKEHAAIAPGWKLAAKIAAAIASVVGLLSLLEFLFSWDFGIDQLLFRAAAEDMPGSVRAGLMAPIGALGFLFLGLALLLLDARTRLGRWWGQLLPCSVALASMFGILDFVLDPNTTHTHISPVTSFALFLLSFGLMFARTQSGFGFLVGSATLGGTLTRRLFPAAILVPLVFGWLRWQGEVAGLFSEWTGLAMMTAFSMLLLASLTAWTGFVVDRGDRKRRQGEETISRLAAIVTSSSDAIIGKTIDGVVTSWNPGAEAIYGYAAPEIVGQPISITIPPDRREEFAAIMERVKQGQRVTHCETARLRKNGQIIQVSLSVSPLMDKDGNIVGASTIARDITESKRAEDTLRHTSLYARSLIEASLDPLVTISRDGKITDVNEATEKVTGASREKLIGSDFSSYFTEPESARRGYEQVFAQGAVQDYPLAIRSAAGKVTDVLYNASVYRDPHGNVLGVFAAARDVTAQRQASQYARSLIEASLDPLVTISPEGKITDVNEATIKVTGMPRAHLIGTDFSNYFTEPDKAREGYRQVFEKGFVTDYPLTIRRRDGKLVDVLYNASVYRDVNGNVMGVFAAARDVTESRRLMREYADTKNFLGNILQSSTKYSIIGKDLDHKILSWNEGGRLNYGYEESEVIGKDSSILHAPEDIQSGAVDKMLSTAYEKGLAEGEFQRVRKDGSRFMASVVVTRRNDSSGRAIGYLLMSNNITEKKQAEEKVRQASLYTRRLIEASLDPLVTISREGKITDVNRATEIVTGVSREGLMGSDFSSYFTQPESARRGYEQVFAQGAVQDYPLAIRSTAGKVTDVLYNASVFRNEAGEVEGAFAAARDITERKRAEERVIQRTAQLEVANKELEAFTYSVSHDLRAPLRHISGFSKILTEEYGSSLAPEAQHHLQRIQEGTRRMGQLVDDLLNLARVGRRDLSLQVSGLKSIVDEGIAELAPQCEGRQIEWKIGNLPFVECDPGLVKQVFQNLLSNAVKFTRPRSQAAIEVGQKDQEGTPVMFVRDNGVGFSMKYADKLFGVFQRLHRSEDFEGTGVGLATAQRIIQKHGGRIWAEAELEKGATFYFTLGASEKTDLKTKAAMAGDKA